MLLWSPFQTAAGAVLCDALVLEDPGTSRVRFGRPNPVSVTWQHEADLATPEMTVVAPLTSLPGLAIIAHVLADSLSLTPEPDHVARSERLVSGDARRLR